MWLLSEYLVKEHGIHKISKISAITLAISQLVLKTLNLKRPIEVVKVLQSLLLSHLLTR